jgi:hypothetical protein
VDKPYVAGKRTTGHSREQGCKVRPKPHRLAAPGCASVHVPQPAFL